VPPVPSEKRARQRALRQQKQAEIQKSRKRRNNTRRIITGVVLAAVIVGIVFLLSGTGSKTAATTTTTTAGGSSSTTTSGPTTSTTTGTTFPVPTTQPLSTAAIAPTCPPTAGSASRQVWFTSAPGSCISPTAKFNVTFKTSVGDVVVLMDAAKSLAAVNNFVFLARYQYFNGTTFHRIIPGFVVQGGDPTGTGSGGTHAYPGYTFTGNTPPAGCKTQPKLAGCYVPGDLAMANSKGPSTNTSQFFFVLPGGQNQLNTEPNYTIFGSVTSGMSVVEKIGTDGTSSGTPTTPVYLTGVTVTQTAS
jgi:cyclophilin family peptidyl-prolyl cis-trans isomerase